MAQQPDVSSMVAVLALLLGVFASILTNVESIGVCYGMMGDNLPTPDDVVQLYQSNGITGMRIYAPDDDTLNALRGTGISLIIGVANSNLSSLASNSSAADDWVNNYVVQYSDVSFKYIAVGNEVTGDDVSNILPAMQNIYSSLSSAGLQDEIKVSTSVAFNVVSTSFPPSAGVFASNASYITSIVQYLANISAPLLANIYTYFSYTGDPKDITLDYALFTSNTTMPDGQYNYQNLFDAMVDALYSAMEKVNGSNVDIVISESGWPSAGGNATVTTVSNAQIYNQNLINHVGNGTPKRPTALETYIFAMFNEDLKASGIEQNWGLFYPNETAVYPIKFS